MSHALNKDNGKKNKDSTSSRAKKTKKILDTYEAIDIIYNKYTAELGKKPEEARHLYSYCDQNDFPWEYKDVARYWKSKHDPAQIKKRKIIETEKFALEAKNHNDNLSKLQSNYFPKNGYKVAANKLDPIARILLIAVYDDNDPFSVFRGMRYLVEKIWSFTVQFNKHFYSKHIQIKADPVSNGISWHTDYNGTGKSIAFRAIEEMQLCHWPYKPTVYSELRLPAPLKEEININMMPISLVRGRMCEATLKEQLPKKLHGYIAYIIACTHAQPSFAGYNKGNVCYLTIHESFVKKGHSQRRPGLHIEHPGDLQGSGGDSEWFRGWGGGFYQRDGIYMASNVDHTCATWNCRIDERNKKNIIGTNGNLEHLRSALPKDKKYLLEAHKLYWMTDRTPHEALPMKEDGWRQFFRLVSHKLGIWYEQHSTKNPIGIVPDPRFTKISKENKFDKK